MAFGPAKPIGAEVGISLGPDFGPVEEGDYLQSPTTRTYLIVSVRVQHRGIHAGSQHLRCIIVNAKSVASTAVVHEFYYTKK